MNLFKTIKVADAFNSVINSLMVVINILRVLAVLFVIIQAALIIKKENA